MTQPTQAQPELYQSGGSLGPDLITYVQRDADSQLLEELRNHHYCYVLTPRQMGKTSLIVRTGRQLTQEGIANVTLDLTGMGKGATEEQWYTGHADDIAQALALPPSWEEWWDEHAALGPVQRFGRFLADYILENIKSDLVIFIDEIDYTIGLPFSDDYFAAIRALFNRRPLDARLQRLTFALFGVAAPTDLIKDERHTPFNIGTRIELTDFTWQEASPLLQGLAPEPDLAQKLLERILFWTGGHPYLSQKACQEVAIWAQSDWDPRRVPAIVDDKIRETFLTDGRRRADPNLQFVSARVSGGSEGSDSDKRKLLQLYREIRRGVRVPSEDLDPVQAELKLAGLVVPGREGLRVRNRIYETVFDETWVRSVSSQLPTDHEPEAATAYDVFVSYSHEDALWVQGYLIPTLKAAGLKVASDLELIPGSDWTEELPRMRETSRFFLPVLSPSWVASRGAQEEYALMSNRVGKIVPVLWRSTRLPAFLESIRYANFTEPAGQDDAMKQVLLALGVRIIETPPARHETAATPDLDLKQTLPDKLAATFSREDLVKLVSEHFEGLIRQIDMNTPVETIAVRLTAFAEQTNRLEELSGLLATAHRKDEPKVESSPAARQGGYHAFVAMPFGRKQEIDFNRIYQELIRPALESAGYSVFRADEELRAGDIRTDMFQELLLADLVVAELSIDNPNVWYELGVRHALRARGVIQIQATREHMPFDVYVDRALRYHVKGGVPDPEYLEADRAALATFAKNTMDSWFGRKISPVYHLLGYLKEPDWKSLRVDEATQFWAAQDDLERRIQVARRLGRPGDIMVLADEAPFRALQMEAFRSAAKALRSLGQYKLALEQCERALGLDPLDLESRSLKGLLLSRLKRSDEATEWLKAVLRDHENDAETWGLLGRVKKDAWIDCWRKPGATPEAMRAAAVDEDAMLREAIDAYVTGFENGPGNFYPGINAATLLRVREHLTADVGDQERRLTVEGGVRWAVRGSLRQNPSDYWARVTGADLTLLSGDKPAVQRAYGDAVAAAEKDWFALDSSRQQLMLLNQLGFRPDVVPTALGIFDRAMARLTPPEQQQAPAQVVLFSGHMIDRKDRSQPRFPADKESVAAVAIDGELAKLALGAGDLGLCGGANGGDLLFAEACLQRGMRLEIRIPFDEPKFLRESVSFAGDRWRDRFYAVKAHPSTRVFVMPDELGPTPAGADPYSRNNLWLLNSALAWGDERLRFVCLWDGRGGDGPGGTKHMYEVVQKRTGRVHHLKTSELFGLATAE
jgi:tetratricopeptide (TPR) repeat protein